eukprot:63073-Amphidinium_carterae.4
MSLSSRIGRRGDRIEIVTLADLTGATEGLRHGVTQLCLPARRFYPQVLSLFPRSLELDGCYL